MSRVSYAMSPRGGGGDDRRPCARRSTGCSRRWPIGPASSATRSSSSRSSATRSCTTSSSASTRRRSARRRSRSRPTRAVELTRGRARICAHPGARVYVLPCIAGHVGADAAGVILAETPYLADEVDARRRRRHERRDRPRQARPAARRLVADRPGLRGRPDLGGQRAAPGAIERVRIDRDDARAALPGHRRRAWSDEAGFGALATAGPASPASAARGSSRSSPSCSSPASSPPTASSTARWPRGRRGSCPTAGRSPTSSTTAGRRAGRASSITQNDVRAIQLAKAALYAGARLLMDHLGVETVDEVKLAGAFGSQIDPLHALVLGLVPDCALDACPGGRQRRRHRRAHRAALAARPGARSSASCGRSRRSRPRSSRASRSTSSTRWPSRTGPRRPRTCERVSTLPRPADAGRRRGGRGEPRRPPERAPPTRRGRPRGEDR